MLDALDPMNTNITHDDILGGDTVPVRLSHGRSSQELMQARRLKVLELYSSGLGHQITPYVESLGFSRDTAYSDLVWAREEWAVLHNGADTVGEIIQKHTAKYYEWAATAQSSGELKLAKDMLQAVEKLRGFHSSTVAVQVNNNVTTNTTTNHNLESLSLEELKNLQLLLAKTTPPATDATT